MNVYESLNHKWLKVDSPNDTLSSLISLSEQSTIESHKNKRNNCDDSDVNVNLCDQPQDDQEKKEITIKSASTTNILTCDQDEEKENKLCQLNSSTVVVKTVLEKSATVNFPIFPDAPTTPKVCRKAPYDDAEVKQIVKKYAPTSNPPCSTSAPTSNPEKILIEDSFCCSTFSCCKSLDCLVCNPDHHLHAKKSLEIDKGIIC